MKYEYEILEQEVIATGFLKLSRYRLRHRLFAGGWSEEIVRERVEPLRASSVLLYDPQQDAVVLIEQFRIGALESRPHAWQLEIIGGHIGEDETPEEVARRESLEEAGCEILDLLPICEFLVTPGTAGERVYLFCGRVDAATAGGIYGIADEGEDIRVEVMKADDAFGEIYNGRINSTTGIMAIQWLALHRDQVLERWV
ncbi:ADP-ribose pyrophosphatase [hydrothermal vent metagenome]|uniref:ADP-ribose pyrophosphatase n=1 Tax=hydrothermal vent metagenome TaxID=652676 RepID=A0A3B1B2Q9_9ZZZZ